MEARERTVGEEKSTMKSEVATLRQEAKGLREAIKATDLFCQPMSASENKSVALIAMCPSFRRKLALRNLSASRNWWRRCRSISRHRGT